MKKLFLIALIPFILFSCNNDYAELYRSFAVAKENRLLDLDSGTEVYTSNATVPDGMRILMDYEITSDKTATPLEVEILRFSKILTKPVVALTPENTEEIGDYPFYNIYGLGISGGYININFALQYSGYTHYINMVQQDAIGLTEGSNVVNLEFRQNASGIGQYVRSGLVSFDINEYRELALAAGLNELEFNIRIKYFDEIKEYKRTYKVDNSTNETISFNGTAIGDEPIAE